MSDSSSDSYCHKDWEETIITYKDSSEKTYNHLNFKKFENLEDIVKIEYREACDETYLRPFPDEVGKCINLEVLDVGGEHGTAINALPESIGNCTKLRYIAANGGDGPMDEYSFTLPENIGNCINLKELNLWCSNIKSFPESIGNCINLKEIYAPFGKLTSLPGTFGNLKNLEELNFEGNDLISLPESIGNLKNLRKLNIANNKLTSLPESIGNLVNLKVLECWIERRDIDEENKLDTFLFEKFNIKVSECSIAKDDIDENTKLITVLPESIGNLNKLEILNFKGHNITSLPESIINNKGFKTDYKIKVYRKDNKPMKIYL